MAIGFSGYFIVLGYRHGIGVAVVCALTVVQLSILPAQAQLLKELSGELARM